MPGILPEYTAGGLDYRDAAGAPINPPNVHNAYPPAPAFLSSCLLTALPTDCTARIEAKQINAIVSELLAFAECMDPDGTWDCNSLNNLCTAFTAWVMANICHVFVGDTAPSAPCPNQLWWQSNSSIFWLWYNDGNSTQWVQVNGASAGSDGGAGGTQVYMDNVSIVGAGTAGDPHFVGLIDGGSY